MLIWRPDGGSICSGTVVCCNANNVSNPLFHENVLSDGSFLMRKQSIQVCIGNINVG